MIASPKFSTRWVKNWMTLNLSVNAHASRVVAIVAHHDCAAFPASRDQHLAALVKCADVIESWLFPVRVLTLWVDETWQVELIHDSRPERDAGV